MIKRSFTRALLPAVLICMVSGIGLKAQTLDEAITFTKNEQYDNAETLFKQLVQSDPSNSELYFHYGENTLLNYFADTISNSLTATMNEAADIFNKGVEANPNDPLNFVGLAKVATYRDDEAKAEELRMKAKSLLPPYKKIKKIENPTKYAYTLGKLAESYIHFTQVDTSKALPFIREALTIDPRNSEVYIIAGDIYILVNDGSKAIKNYNLAQDWDLQSPTANMKIGSIYVKGRNLTAAIPYYEQAIALDQNYAPAYRELGQLYSMAGRFSESKKYFEKYLELTAGNIPAKIRYVNALFYAKEYQEVIKNVEEIFKIDDSRTYMNRIAGYSAYEEGDYDLALYYMDRLFSTLDPEHLIKKDYIYLARILVRKNQDIVKMSIEADNNAADLNKLEAQYVTMKGAAREKAKEQIDALKTRVDSMTAKVASCEKQITRAFEAYEKAANFDGQDLNMLNEKGNYQYAFHRYADAATTWSGMLDKGRDSENDYLQVGKAFYQAKKFDKADEIFSKMIAKYPDNMQGYLWGANNASAKDPDSELGLARPKFIAVLQKASADSVKYATEIYNALRYLGYEALQDKRFDEAKAYYERMINLSPDFKIRGLSSMSTLYMTMGEYNKAIEENNRILAIEPGNDAAKSTISYITQLQKSAQPKPNPNEITGIISDSSTGDPLPGASVRVKDTAAEAWTNARGEYKFVMPEASEILVISAKGYKTIEVPVTKRRVYNASLEK
jgi:tetratricopeptide (TPR) repeat protein